MTLTFRWGLTPPKGNEGGEGAGGAPDRGGEVGGDRPLLRTGIDLMRLADGDRAAFDGVFAHLWPVVHSLAARYLPAIDVEDAAQAALLRLFERASEFDPACDAVAWAIGLAMWEIRTVRRRWWRRRDTNPLAFTYSS
jgi:DNA-directed RNA polymerase specialized sigma24 family protein